MANKSSIEWCDTTWNPIVGCSVVSPGCTNCYAMRLAGTRLQLTTAYRGLTQESKAGPVWNGKVRLLENRLTDPLRWRAPKDGTRRRVFVNSMGDLFHELVSEEWIDRVLGTIALAPHHDFLVLTKRAERMHDFMQTPKRIWKIFEAVRRFVDNEYRENARFELDETPWPWPLPNLWLGISAEDQQRANQRIPLLLATPAAVRFISAEPLLGPVDLRAVSTAAISAAAGNKLSDCLHWVIVGGESGKDARPFDLDWATSIINQCRGAGIPCFVKQLGSLPFSATKKPPFTLWQIDDGPSAYETGPFYADLRNSKGGDPAEWPKNLRVREMPR